MHRTYCYRLYPTRSQREALDGQLSSACHLYNAALEHRRLLWREHGISVSYGDQSAELSALRRGGLLCAGANFWSQQEVLKRLDRAFQGFFRRVRSGERPGYPRFKSVRRFNTLTFSFAGNAGGVAIRDGRLYLQGIGHIKVKWHRKLPPDAELRQVTVTRRPAGRDGERFFAAFQLRIPTREVPTHAGAPVGVDLGIRSFARLSNGEEIAGPRVSARSAAKRRRIERSLARKRRGSRRRGKAVAQLSRHRERERDRRRDHAHKVSWRLADRFSLIAIEDLHLTAMTRSARGTVEEPGRGVAAKSALNREIADQGWAGFSFMLAYKAEEAGGRVVRVDPWGSSQTCAACGTRDRRSRQDARFKCVSCGHIDHADTNAARVLLTWAQRQGPGRGLQAPTNALASVA